MKARVIATGEIVEVQEEYDLRNDRVEVFYSNVENSFDTYEREELDFNIKDDNIPNYWERLKHQYAGMAMQGLLMNEHVYCGQDMSDALDDFVSTNAVFIATALVEKLNEERK